MWSIIYTRGYNATISELVLLLFIDTVLDRCILLNSLCRYLIEQYVHCCCSFILMRNFRGASASFLYFKIKHIMSELTSAYYYLYFLNKYFFTLNSFLAYIVLRCAAQDSQKTETYNGDQPCNPGGGLDIFYFFQLRWLQMI